MAFVIIYIYIYIPVNTIGNFIHRMWKKNFAASNDSSLDFCLHQNQLNGIESRVSPQKLFEIMAISMTRQKKV